MSKMQIHDSEGGIVTPHDEIDDYGDQVKQWALNGVRLVATPGNDLFGIYFRAKSSSEARSEQYYGLIHPSKKQSPLQELVELVQQWSAETGEIIVDEHETMELYQYIADQKAINLELDDGEMSIIKKLADDDDPHAVIMESCEDALGLLIHLGTNYDIVIARGDSVVSEEGYDLTISYDATVSQIEPAEDTVTAWNGHANRISGVSLRGELTEDVSDGEESTTTDSTEKKDDGGFFSFLPF